MKIVKLGTLAALGASLVIASGCYMHSAVQQHMGEAQRENIARMTKNPLAGQATVPAEGLDSRTAEQVMEKHHELQRKLPDQENKSRSIFDIDF